MDYKKTLNLPRMNFPMKVDVRKTESETLSLWQSLNVYEKRLKHNKGKPKYIIHTQPIQAYGDVNADDTFNLVLKDVMIKYKLMSGFDVANIPVWNSYVPSVERDVIQSLIDKNGDSITINTLKSDETWQIQLRDQCHEICQKYVDIQKVQLQRLGIFARWNKAILTSDPNYESEVIDNFERLYKSGYLRKGTKSRFWCISCESEIDDSEIEYKGHDLLSLHVKFPVMHGLEELGENLHLLVWMNTPWTLSTLKPIAVHPDYEYSAVEMENGTVLVMADIFVKEVMGKFRKEEYRIIRQMKGSELANVLCSHPLMDKSLKVIQDKHVSLEKGTGFIVAGHAEQDDDIIDFSSGSFDKIHISESDGFYNGNVFEPSNPLSTELERRGYLLSSDLMEQLYPHCTYCKQPLLVKPNEHWLFDFNANHLKQHAVKALNNIKCISDRVKKRISDDISNRNIWSISQRRMRGIPIPVFYCNECNLQLDVTESIRSCKALIESKGVTSLINTKPDDILPYDIVCNKCGAKDFRWEIDTLNPDFISMLNYNIMLWNQKESYFDVDDCMSSGNRNGKWVPLSLLHSMAIDGGSFFKSVVIHGPVTNTIPVNEFLDMFGAEILRLCAVLTDSSKYLKLTDSHAQSVSKAYTRIRNILRFLISNLSDYDHKDDLVDYKYLKDIDRWILHKLAKLTVEVTNALDNCQFHKAYSLIYDFCSMDVSKIYVSIVRRRLYAFPKWSTGRRSIQTVIYEIVTKIVRLMAPILSFTAEEMWSYIPNVKKYYPSVYMSKWPEVTEEFLDEELESQWDFILKIRSAIYKTFEKNRIKDDINNLSQAHIILYTNVNENYSLLDKNVENLPEIFMVSRVGLMPLDSPVPDGIYVLDGVDGLSMEIRHTTGEKCERCLIYSDTVGTSEQYPTLCDKCIFVLDGETDYA